MCFQFYRYETCRIDMLRTTFIFAMVMMQYGIDEYKERGRNSERERDREIENYFGFRC